MELGIEVSDAAVAELAKAGFDPVHGAPGYVAVCLQTSCSSLRTDPAARRGFQAAETRPFFLHYFPVSSCVAADGPFSLHETIPWSRAASELYIWLVPMTSPFPDFNTK